MTTFSNPTNYINPTNRKASIKMKKHTLLISIALIALFAFAGTANAYSIKGGKLYLNVSSNTQNTLLGWYGVTYDTSVSDGPSIGPFSFNSGGVVNSNGTASAKSPSSQTLTIRFANDNTANSATTLNISKLSTTIGKDGGYVTGYVTGSIYPAIPGTSVAPGTYKIFSLSKGAAKKSSSKSYKYVYSGQGSFNPQLTSLINSLVTGQPGTIPLPSDFKLGKATASFK